MNQKIFEDCHRHYLSNFMLGETWKTLAIKWKYESGEKLRLACKAERKRQGVPNKGSEATAVPVRSRMPKVAICDIEVLPGLAYFWRLFDDHISPKQVIKPTCFVSWAGKFLNDSEIYSDILTPKEAITRNPKRIAKSCWDFLSKADIVIGHNFAGYDVKHINTVFLKYGLPPLKFIVVDTLSVARQNFKFDSNSMETINKELGIRNKIDNDGLPLWIACDNGDAEALKTMEEYNIGDIYSTEDLFYMFRPYIKNFNVALYNEIDTYQCPVCGSDKLHSAGMYGKWEALRCENCQALSRKSSSAISKEKRKVLLTKI